MNAFKRIVMLAGLVCQLAACGSQAVEENPVSDSIISAEEMSPGNAYTLLSCAGNYFNPKLIAPSGLIDVVPTLTFTWDDNCIPESYNLAVYRWPKETSPLILNASFSTTDGFYTAPVVLEPMTGYVWELTIIPESPGEVRSMTKGFVTGPICNPAELVAPIPVSPIGAAPTKGKTTPGDPTEVILTMQWNPSSACLPEDSISIDVFDNPGLTGFDYNSGKDCSIVTGEPDTVRLCKSESDPLNNCTMYFWHGYAVAGSINGPSSETASFYTDFNDDCLQAIYYKAITDANCRINPWTGAAGAEVIEEGEVVQLLGRDEGGFWGKFRDGEGQECWSHFSSYVPQPDGYFFNPLLMGVLAHDPKPTREPGPGGDTDDSSKPSNACLVPDYSVPGVVTWNCVSPCPDPAYASKKCKP